MNKDALRRQRAARKAAHQCADCGEPLPTDATLMRCVTCRQEDAARCRRRRELYAAIRVRRGIVRATPNHYQPPPPIIPLRTENRVYGGREFTVVWPALGKADGVKGGPLMPPYDSKSSLGMLAAAADTNLYTHSSARARHATTPAINLVSKG